MKRIISILLMAAMVLVLAACGSAEATKNESSGTAQAVQSQEAADASESAETSGSAEASGTAGSAESSGSAQSEEASVAAQATSEPEAPKDPVSLVGTWADAKGAHVAVVDEDTITIYWIVNGTYQLYWTGSCQVPDTYCEVFAWESENFHDITNQALLASTEDTKRFLYKDGSISFSGTLQNQSFTNTLTPKTITGIETLKPGSVTTAAAEKKQLELVTGGYSASVSYNYVYVPYTVVIHNPNEGYAITYPEVVVTTRDANGVILNSEEQSISYIAAGDTVVYSDYVSWEGTEAPAKVEVSLKARESNYETQTSEYLMYDAFEAKNVSVRKDTIFTKVTGEITNLSARDVSMLTVSITFKKDGKYIGGDTGYVDGIGAGETAVFDISLMCTIEDYDEVLISCFEW